MADDTLVEELKKLPPEERIKRLKKIEEERKKEIEEAQLMMKQSENEIEEKEKAIRRIPIPQIRAVNVDMLFTPEEKEIFKVARFVEDRKKSFLEEMGEERGKAERAETLEETVFREQPRFTQEQMAQQQQYALQLSTRPIDELQNRAENLYRTQAEQGYLNIHQQEERQVLAHALYEKEKAIQQGSYRRDEELMDQIDTTRKILGYRNRM